MTDIQDVIASLCDADDWTLSRMSMNAIADLYRNGADLRTLVPLLTHPNPHVVECGAWIASEVVDGARGREIFPEIAQLLVHSNPAVRFWSIESFALTATPEDRSDVHKFFMLAADPNLGVRQQALYWICLTQDAIVESLRGTDIWPSARLLLSDVSKSDIRIGIKSERLFDQRMAVAATLRNFGSDDGFIHEIFPCFDADVVSSLPRLPRNRALP